VELPPIAGIAEFADPAREFLDAFVHSHEDRQGRRGVQRKACSADTFDAIAAEALREVESR
jgi:hypothetical protein